MHRRSSGFTLIELLIVIGILGVLAAALLPSARQSQIAANVELDAAQLRQHFAWLQLHAARNNRGLPAAGGHRFVLATWGVTDQTAEDLDRYFTPGARDNDAHYQALRKRVLRGERVWQDLTRCSPDDTTYCGRDARHLRTAMTGGWRPSANGPSRRRRPCCGLMPRKQA